MNILTALVVVVTLIVVGAVVATRPPGSNPGPRELRFAAEGPVTYGASLSRVACPTPSPGPQPARDDGPFIAPTPLATLDPLMPIGNPICMERR